jgi:hypothetical protein
MSETVRRTSSYLISPDGPAIFDLQWKRDISTTIQIFTDDGLTGPKAISAGAIETATLSVRLRPYEPSVVAASWSLIEVAGSIYGEWRWDVSASNLASLTWDVGQRRQTLWADISVGIEIDEVDYVRSVEDGTGAFLFPVHVWQSIRGSPA